ncbi:MAG: DUF1465 family protein [Rhodospirillaceae bacterium]
MPVLSLSAADAEFVQATFDDTMALIEAARDHIADGSARHADPAVTPRARMRASQELSRLTSRATAAISLLLLFKAVESGQDVGVPDIPAQMDGILADIQRPPLPSAGDEPMPESLTVLVVRAETIFERMPRLHALLRTIL